jgi:hypothetical protein
MENLDNKFTKTRSTKDIITGISFIVAGIILATLPTNASLNLMGYLLTPIGFVLLLVLKSNYKLQGYSDVFHKKEYYFPDNTKEALLAAINTNPAAIDTAEMGHGNTMRLVIYYSKKSQKAFLQLSEYIPYKYETCSEIFEHSINEINNLI